jgi:hypothetical protein
MPHSMKCGIVNFGKECNLLVWYCDVCSQAWPEEIDAKRCEKEHKEAIQ